MSVFDQWQSQKDGLRKSLQSAADLADVTYHIRHALNQTEQNALAAMADDVLRQQAGVLLGCLKTSVGLLECQIQTQVWLPQSQKKARGVRPSVALMWLAAALVALLAAFCYLKGQWLGFLAAVGAVAAFLAAMVLSRKEQGNTVPQEEIKVTLRPDIDRLFAVLDGQLRSVDRYLNDFDYLNNQLRDGSQTADPLSLTRVTDLMEALYEWDEDARQTLTQPVRRLTESMGLSVLDYTPENRRYFNALPSKSTTRTLSPAILSMKDHQLLRRGTAAVQMDAA